MLLDLQWNKNRPFALSGLETWHPAAAGPSPAYDFSVFDEPSAVFLVSVWDCFGCFSSGLDHLNSSWSIARLREYLWRKIGHSWTARKPSFVSGKCPYIVTSHCTRRLPPAGLCDCSKCDSSGFDWTLETQVGASLVWKSIWEKRGHSRLLFKKAELLERQISLNRHLAYKRLRVHPGAFPSATWNKQTKKSLLAQTSPALQPLPLVFCQLPLVSGLSPDGPDDGGGKHIAFPTSTSFVLSLGTAAGKKKTPMALRLLSGSV